MELFSTRKEGCVNRPVSIGLRTDHEFARLKQRDNLTISNLCLPGTIKVLQLKITIVKFL